MRLCDWRLSPDGSSFAYGGNEVELSLWNTELALSASSISANDTLMASSSKKRKRDALLPGETWRARNVPNDALSLRVPVYNTSLAFVGGSGGGGGFQLLAGTLAGDVRKYDTRVARKPVAEWKSIVKTGSVKRVQAGVREK
jgi:ribosome biogenesis protein NSA1